MKKTFSLINPVVIFLVMALGGCSIDKASPPSATVIGGTPSTVQVTLSSATIANSGSATVTATVTDASANVVPNVNVSFSVISATAGSFSPASAVTNASGQATATFTAGAAVDAVATIRAAVTVGASTISGTAQITIGTPPRVPTLVVVSLSPTTIAATGGATTVTATVTDASGWISGVTVSFSASVAGAGSLSAATATTDASGIATVTYTANAGNTYVNITATAASLNNSATLMIGSPPPPVPVSMSITINPLTVSIQSQAVVSATLRDVSGNPAFNNGVTFLITGGTSTGSFSPLVIVSSVTATTNASGVATATFYSSTTSGSINIQAQSTVGGLMQSASILITSSPASISIGVLPAGASSTITNGQTLNIAARVLNIANFAVTDGTVVNFAITSLPPNAGTLSASAGSTISGEAKVTFTADPVLTGGVIVQASVTGLTPVQLIVIVNPALAGSLQFVSATPVVINISGGAITDSTVIFEVKNQVGASMANQPVDFTLFGPTGATLDATGTTTSSGSTNSDGLVTTFLHAGNVAGPVRILASTVVDPGPPAVKLSASSGAISIGGGLPSMRFLSTSVEKFNVDGLYCDGVTDTITVRMADRFGNYNIVQGTNVSFTDDYGAINTSNVTNASGETSSIWKSLGLRPANGLVAILVQTTGEENFTDMNGDGIYTYGTDTFTAADDLPEPFIDNNGDDTWEAGELFFNWPSYVPSVSPNAVNPNGVYDQGPGPFYGNGVWDAEIPIFQNVHIWMTGPPNVSATTSRVRCCDPSVNPTCVPAAAVATPITISNGGSTVCYVYGSDENGNALIGKTTVKLSSSNTSDVDIPTTPYSGFATYVDHQVNGPEITGFTVTNKNASTTIDTTTTLSAEIDWPGTCGKLTVYFSYPGTVTLIRHP